MRWILALGCIFLSISAVLAQGSARFVVLEEGTQHPLEGAFVEFPETEHLWLTKRDGAALSGPLDAGKYRYHVWAQINGIAYKRKEGHVTIREGVTTTVTVQLRKLGELIVAIDDTQPTQGAIRFLVRDAQTRLPLPGAPIRISGREELLRTQQDGTAQCLLKPGKVHYEARALKDGFAYGPTSGTAWVKAQLVTNVEILLKRGKKIFLDGGEPRPRDWGVMEFVVTDATTKKPLEGVVVVIEPQETDGETRGGPTSKWGKFGIGTKAGTYRYAIVGFVNGTFYKRQYGEVTILPGKDEQRTIELHPVGG